MGVAFKGIGLGKDAVVGTAKNVAVQGRLGRGQLAPDDVIVTPQGDLKVTKVNRQKNQAFAQDAKGNVLVYNLSLLGQILLNSKRSS
jgi:phosphohistidine swiveling domain-containing protein